MSTHELMFISVAARMLDMHPQTLRKYERLGLVRPARRIGSMRLYSHDEIERLRCIKRLVDDAGVNLAGVQQLLSIAEVIQRMRPLRDRRALGETSSSPPKNAWKKSENGLSPPPPPPPNMSDISSGVIDRNPPAPPKGDHCWPGWAPPWPDACSCIRQLAPSSSYFLRLTGSLSTSLASFSSLNRASAPLSPGFTSG